MSDAAAALEVAARLRVALRELIDATDSVKNDKGITARQKAHAVYLDTLPEETKRAMLTAAQAIFDAAPQKTFVSGTARCETFREALDGFGTSLLNRVIAIGAEGAAQEFTSEMNRHMGGE